MRSLLITVALIASAGSASAQLYGTGSNSHDHYVSGYTRSDGTSVGGHYRTNPNSTQLDNYGTSGNYNSHTGSYGSRLGRF